MHVGWSADQVTPLFPFLWLFLSTFVCFSIRLRSARTILSSTYPPHVSSSIMLLVTGASVLISYLYVATIHYVYTPLWSWVNSQLVIDLASGHSLLSDLSISRLAFAYMTSVWSTPYSRLILFQAAFLAACARRVNSLSCVHFNCYCFFPQLMQ
jgi:hypothetical protein